MPGINWKLIHNAINNYEKYPPELRIAKYLFKNSITEKDFDDMGKSALFSLPSPVIIKIQNELRNMHNGFYSEKTLKLIPELEI